MNIIVLNLISALFAIAATYVGVTDQDTWSKEERRPTKTGITVIVLACLTAAIQSSIQIMQWLEKKQFDGLAEQVYNGWISVGVYDKEAKKWDKLFLGGLQTPEKIDHNGIYIVSSPLYIRTPPPDDCPDNNNIWFSKEAKSGIILPEGKYVKIVDSKPYDNCDKPGKIRVVAKVVLVSKP